MLDQITNYLIPISTVLLSFFAFFFSLSEFLSKRAKITFTLIDREEVIEFVPDRSSKTTPDVLWNLKRRLFPTVVISNMSSNPITIIDITLNDDISFSRYRELHGPVYETTTQTNQTKFKGGILINGDDIKVTGMKIEGEILEKVFTIPPYTSVRGTLFFAYNNSLIGRNKLKIKTPKKDFIFDITVSKSCESVLPPFDPGQLPKDFQD